MTLYLNRQVLYREVSDAGVDYTQSVGRADYSGRENYRVSLLANEVPGAHGNRAGKTGHNRHGRIDRRCKGEQHLSLDFTTSPENTSTDTVSGIFGIAEHRDGEGGKTCLKARAAKAAEAEAEGAATNLFCGTPESRQLCESISRQSGGTCFLGFSRGKDSITSWLYLRQFFSRIIPFHCASVPHLKFVDESLSYYEQYFGTQIERCMDGDCVNALRTLVFQPLELEEEIDNLHLLAYSKHEIVDWLRAKYKLPFAWCAYGISKSDSIDRRIYVTKYNGRIEKHRSFYPCFNWTRAQVLAFLQQHGVKLPPDYLLSNRSMAALPRLRHLLRMRELFPQDFERIKLTFPFIEAQFARNEFRGQA